MVTFLIPPHDFYFFFLCVTPQLESHTRHNRSQVIYPHSLFHNPSDSKHDNSLCMPWLSFSLNSSDDSGNSFGDGLSYVLNYALCILTIGGGL